MFHEGFIAVRFALDTTGNRILRADVLDRHVPLAVEPTVGAVAGNVFVYVANSQWNNYEEDGTRKVSVALAPPVLLAVPLTW
jgi:hypothetical protein